MQAILITTTTTINGELENIDMLLMKNNQFYSFLVQPKCSGQSLTTEGRSSILDLNITVPSILPEVLSIDAVNARNSNSTGSYRPGQLAPSQHIIVELAGSTRL